MLAFSLIIASSRIIPIATYPSIDTFISKVRLAASMKSSQTHFLCKKKIKLRQHFSHRSVTLGKELLIENFTSSVLLIRIFNLYLLYPLLGSYYTHHAAILYHEWLLSLTLRELLYKNSYF